MKSIIKRSTHSRTIEAHIEGHKENTQGTLNSILDQQDLPIIHRHLNNSELSP